MEDKQEILIEFLGYIGAENDANKIQKSKQSIYLQTSKKIWDFMKQKENILPASDEWVMNG